MSELRIDTGGGNVLDCIQVVDDVVMKRGDEVDAMCWQRLLARVAELEAVLAKFDERWLMDGELGFCVACGVSIEGGESHKPECWLTEANAARGAK